MLRAMGLAPHEAQGTIRLSAMAGLQELAPDLIIPCHCTGEWAVAKLAETFAERVVPGAAGATCTFGPAVARTVKGGR